MTRTVLVIDDETNMRWVLQRTLEEAGYHAASVASGDEALRLLLHAPVDLVLLDLKLRGEDGLTVLRRIRERCPEVVVMMLTAYGTVPHAVEAMHLGAADFLRKPFDVEEVLFKIARALERRTLQQRLADLTERQRQTTVFDTLVGTDATWQQAVAQARHFARESADVLLVGEPGSGRRSLAHAMHAASPRHAAPVVTCSLQSYSDPRSALFGAAGGAGAWVEAGHGSLIITGLAEAAETHAALCERLAQQSARRPRVLGIVSDLAALPPALLGTIPAYIRVPPLRERPGDILLLARTFAAGHELTPHAIHTLEQYAWPGNLIELRGVLTRAIQLSGGARIDVAQLPSWITEATGPLPAAGFQLPASGVNLDHLEQDLIRQALVRAHGNKSRAAELLGLTRHTLLYRMKKYGIDGPEAS